MAFEPYRTELVYERDDSDPYDELPPITHQSYVIREISSIRTQLKKQASDMQTLYKNQEDIGNFINEGAPALKTEMGEMMTENAGTKRKLDELEAQNNELKRELESIKKMCVDIQNSTVQPKTVCVATLIEAISVSKLLTIDTNGDRVGDVLRLVSPLQLYPQKEGIDSLIELVRKTDPRFSTPKSHVLAILRREGVLGRVIERKPFIVVPASVWEENM